MPSICCISDTHNKHKQLTLPPADILIHAGDFSSQGSEQETIRFLEWFDDQPHDNKIFISGNHDFMDEDRPEEFAKLLKIYAPTCIYLNDSSVEMTGLKIHGSPITPWFGGWAFNRQRGKDIIKHWDLIPKDTQVLITHGPPYGIRDQVNNYRSPNNGQHVGCSDLLTAVKTLPKLKAHIFGHIHFQSGISGQDNVIYVNASMLDESYQKAYEPYVIHIN